MLRLLMVMMLCATAIGALQGVAGATGTSGPFTLHTVWQWDEGADPAGITLAAVTTEPSLEESRIALVWVQDRSGWFPTWRLQLQTTDARGTQRVHNVSDGQFFPGSTYTVVLSVHPEGDVVSAAVYSQAQSSPLAVAAVSLDIADIPWYPAIALDSGTGATGPRLLSLDMEPGYRPVATQMDVGERLESGSFLPMNSYEAVGSAMVRIRPGALPPGRFRLWVQPVDLSAPDASEADPILLDTLEPEETTWIELPLANLPLGPIRLTLEYVEEDKVLHSQTHAITVGKVDLHFADLTVDAERNILTGTLYSTANTSLPSVNLDVRIRFVQLVWDEENKLYNEVPWPDEMTVLKAPIGDLLEAEFTRWSVPLPPVTGAWRVEILPTAMPGIQLSVSGDKEYVYTTPTDADHWIAVTDQASQSILVLDPAVADWNSPEAVKWSWAPSEHNGFSRYTPGWGLPSGVKLRRSEVWGGLWMVVVDSRGLAAIVPYPAGDSRRWSRVIEGNLHSAELLPDGNIAVAASTGGFVRVYTSSQGPDSGTYAEFRLTGAHGVLWDPELQLLWAVGDHHLVALRVEGTSAAPRLVKVRESALPTPWGHDLAPVYGDADRLWITTNTRVYQYVKSTDTWLTGFVGGEQTNLRYVKGVGNQPSGRVALTQQKEGTLYTWTTDTVTLLFPYALRTRTGAAFYKARVWSPEYQ